MTMTNWLQIVREVNLKQIEREAESHFALLVAGDPTLTGPLALALGGSDVPAGVHPWIVQQALPLPDDLTLARPALALLVTAAIDPGPDHVEAVRRLKKAGVRTVTVVVGDAAAMPQHVWLPRAGEDARVVVPRQLNTTTVQAALAPVLVAVDGADAALALALARRLPALREAYVTGLIEDVARTNGGVALSTGLVELVPGFSLPLTATDIVVLTKNQVLMAYRIALASGRPADTRVLFGEVLGVIGAGLLFRQVARELVGLLPVVGLVPKVAVAYAGTRLVGTVVRSWAIDGRRIERGELRQMSEAALEGGRALAVELVARVKAGRGHAADPHPGSGGNHGPVQ
jgi:hypothetical protein